MDQQLENRRWLYRVWYYLERRVKELIFGCHMCGQCVVRSTALKCPMTCPKQMRNGPCGGSMDGQCEVYPERPCIWTRAYERADRAAWMKKKMALIQPALDWSLYGSSAWLNIWPEKKTDLSGHAFSPAPKPAANLWEEDEGPKAAGCAVKRCGCRILEQ